MNKEIAHSNEENDDKDHKAKLDFVAFRERIKRLIESLLELRPHEESDNLFLLDDQERVDIKLESQKVKVELFIADTPSWHKIAEMVHLFKTFFSSGLSPLFLRSYSDSSITIEKCKVAEEGFGTIYQEDETSLSLSKGGFTLDSIAIETSLGAFNDHFEVFLTDIVKLVYQPKSEKKKSGRSWYEDYGRDFEKLGCSVMKENTLHWDDMKGLDEVKERLRNTIFTPLQREGLYQKIAKKVLPHSVSVLPKGLILYGPPGCGKTWSMKAIGSEAGLPVVIFPCNAMLTKWYGESESRLAKLFSYCKEAGRMILMIDELDSIARHRKESHETTARLVSILLSELDGLGERGDILVVASVNDLTMIDQAILDRFDIRIEFSLPNVEQIKEVFSYYAQHLDEQDVDEIAKKLTGWNFRKIARFGEDALRYYISQLDLDYLEAKEPPVPQKEDYLKLLNAMK